MKQSFLDITAAWSIVPPIPMPSTIGGHGLGQHVLRFQELHFNAFQHHLQVPNIATSDLFSEPKPFKFYVDFTLSPGTISM